MPVNPLLREELLQFIWQYRLYNQRDLQATNGEKILVLHPGSRNLHDGPDFTAASIRIGNTRWIGNVELHLRSTDWFRHRHQYDDRYANIILHVVFYHDDDRLEVPCLELQQYVPKMLLQHYQTLKNAVGFVPCEQQAAAVPRLWWQSWMERLLADRWEHKMLQWQAWLLNTGNNWEELLYRIMAEGFGLPLNAAPLLDVARSLPYRVLLRYRHQPLLAEALLFGQAGLLQVDFIDPYMVSLQKEFRWLQRKHRLVPMAATRWEWLRVRPAGFPTMRIAAFAALWHQQPRLLAHVLEATTVDQLRKLITAAPTSYWQTHYKPDKRVTKTVSMGIKGINGLLINVVLPFLYFYGKMKSSLFQQQKALDILLRLPAEDNVVIRNWKQHGIVAENALESQALLQLKKWHCDQKGCLGCAIGTKLLKGSVG
ncbi:Protein of unknown function [Chitinophaga jiangningensis]|uniref:DUF2851 domain-containing protein n=1 Tax=Chitinophaga jiangningensis TaxID=1419482 RepID=A0A1M6V8B8_9BACT|nr:DUF2851 family protein [Chitinophaga jiangningensis]SHK77740.1 Protein of unknown function [Chitinophaga jiangningensis]